MKKIFLTGFPGWFSIRFVQLLLNQKQKYQKNNYNIKCLIYPKFKNLPEVLNSNCEKIYGDLTRPEDWQNELKDCDYVVHAAGVIHPSKVSDFFKVNTQGTQNVIDAAISKKVKRFIYISSNSPYGFNTDSKNIFTEDSNYKPYMNYGKSKFLAESIVEKAQNCIETVILNSCWFYGPNQPERQTCFYKMIQNGHPIMFGSGHNRRSMCHIDNLIQAVILALEKNNAKNEKYWIADEKPYSMLEIYETISMFLNVKRFSPRKFPSLVSYICSFVDARLQSIGLYHARIHVAGEMSKDIFCSIEKAKKELGYKPEVSLPEGIKGSIDWIKENNLL